MTPNLQSSLRKGEEVGAQYTLTTPRQLPVGRTGSRLGHQAGSSLEFREHRDYQPGDDLRRIDWGVYARSDRLSVKLYQDEVLPHVDLVLDGSRSMALDGTQKAEATAGLAAILVSAAKQSGFSHTTWLANAGCWPVINGSASPSLWEKLTFTDTETPLQSFAIQPPTWRPQSIRIFLSDLLWMGDPLQLMGFFADRSTHLIVIQILAERDLETPSHGYIQLIDSETGELREVFVDTLMQQKYQDAFARHLQHWRQAARQVGAVFATVVAEKLLSHWSLDALVEAEILQFT